MPSLKTLMQGVSALDDDSRKGADFDIQPLPGDDEVIQVIINGQEELPVFVTASDSQILCICYLWGEDEIQEQSRTALFEAMLDMNIPMPLSSFGRIGDKYAVFGAISAEASAEDMALELATLSDNAVDAIDALSEFLR